jgi:hypothetical protein
MSGENTEFTVKNINLEVKEEDIIITRRGIE